MKKLLLFIIPALMLTGCFPKYEAIRRASILDYTEFTSKGFFVTESNSVSFDYDAIGSVIGENYGGYEVLYKKDQMGDDTYSRLTEIKVKYGKYLPAKADVALREMILKAMEKGANGVINVRINGSSRFTASADTTYYGYIATGMAIRKK